MKIDFSKDTYSNATEVIGDGDFFVSAIDGNQYHLMAGPYPSHDLAKKDVDKVKSICYDLDTTGKAAFMAYGTCRKPTNSGSIGNLNKLDLI